MHKLNFKKYYFISEYDTNLIKHQDKETNIIYRNYKDEIDIHKLIILRDFCKKKGCNFFLSNNIKLAIKLNLDGAYLPSFNRNFNHLAYTFKKKFIILGSVHNIKELNIKKLQLVEYFFLSSLFKKNENYLDTLKFKLFESYINKNIIALGGISEKNLKKLNLLNVSGFAGISLFKKKAPLRKGPFNILDSK